MRLSGSGTLAVRLTLVLTLTCFLLSIATSLAAFSISKPTENGAEVEPLVDFKPGVISHPYPYKCTIRPRSEKAASLVKVIEEERPFTESDADALLSI